jgi:hypothetical protein
MHLPATATHITRALSREDRTFPITLIVLFQMNDKVVPVAVSTSYYELLRTIEEFAKQQHGFFQKAMLFSSITKDHIVSMLKDKRKAYTSGHRCNNHCDRMRSVHHRITATSQIPGLVFSDTSRYKCAVCCG